ncbi:NACHT domain-containing protein [Nucisporomicrobium flavum]|uniref:NACHT domain-containing protein n=1 Tax=Nucisporomicrobium flavum TaxID=2785915 RepID=UPI003C2AD2E4
MLGWLRRPRFLLLTAALLSAVVAGLLFLVHEGREKSDQWASIAAVVFAVITLADTLLTRVWKGGRPLPVTDDMVTEAAANLVRAERRRRRSEYELRRIEDPWPLPIRWARTSNARSVTARWRALRRTDAPEPFLPDGVFTGIADAYSDPRCPGRVVVLGDAGSGKSMLALRLVRDLADRWAEPARIPVLASLSQWNPEVESLEVWLAGRLCEENWELRREIQTPDGGRRTLAAELLSRDLVLPVLDGFDELAVERRAAALRHLDEVFGQARPFVLTSTFDGYRSAGVVVRRTSVVEILPLDPREVADFLHDGDRTTRVYEHLASGCPSPLADALSSPLAVWLAGRIYGAEDADPDELLDAAWATDRSGIERHLLSRFIPSAYAIGPRETLRTQMQIRRVTRHLTAVAAHLERSGRRGFAWWRLRDEMTGPQLLFNLGLLPLSIVLIGLRLAGVDLDDVGQGIFLGLLIGAAFSVPTWLKRGPNPMPRRLTLATIRSRRWMLWLGLLIAAAFGFGFGVPFGLHAGPLTGLVVGAGFAGLAFVIVGVSVDTSPARAGSPAETLRDDRRFALSMGALYAAMSATGSATVIGPVGGAVAGVTGAVVIAGSGEWLPFCLIRAWWALTGRTPWRLMTFLHDANSRGVLRTSGGYYEFRHAALQQHLTTKTPAAVPAALTEATVAGG